MPPPSSAVNDRSGIINTPSMKVLYHYPVWMATFNLVHSGNFEIPAYAMSQRRSASELRMQKW